MSRGKILGLVLLLAVLVLLLVAYRSCRRGVQDVEELPGEADVTQVVSFEFERAPRA